MRETPIIGKAKNNAYLRVPTVLFMINSRMTDQMSSPRTANVEAAPHAKK